MSERTTVQLTKQTKARLDELKQYPSMSYQDLIDDMADVYAATADSKTPARRRANTDRGAGGAAE